MKVFSWIANSEHRGRKLGKVLSSQYGLSRRQLTRLKQTPGAVIVNGRPVYLGTSLNPGDRIKVTMQEHLEPVPAEPIPLAIIYEDDDLLVLNKPAGLVSHPTKGWAGGTLANALSYYWQEKGESRPARLVTRLDRETSGLVLVAKTAWCQHRLSQTEIHKGYLGLTRGIPNPRQGEINLPIGRSPDIPSKRGVDPQGRAAMTRYETVRTEGNIALVKLEPSTGRTHQLRIHMAHIGCPLVDDFMYGIEEGIVGRTALHAHKLAFAHPQRGEFVHFTAPIPEDLMLVIGHIDYKHPQ